MESSGRERANDSRESAATPMKWGSVMVCRRCFGGAFPSFYGGANV